MSFNGHTINSEAIESKHSNMVKRTNELRLFPHENLQEKQSELAMNFSLCLSVTPWGRAGRVGMNFEHSRSPY
jgi:hypothetical protein